MKRTTYLIYSIEWIREKIRTTDFGDETAVSQLHHLLSAAPPEQTKAVVSLWNKHVPQNVAYVPFKSRRKRKVSTPAPKTLPTQGETTSTYAVSRRRRARQRIARAITLKGQGHR